MCTLDPWEISDTHVLMMMMMIDVVLMGGSGPSSFSQSVIQGVRVS